MARTTASLAGGPWPTRQFMTSSRLNSWTFRASTATRLSAPAPVEKPYIGTSSAPARSTTRRDAAHPLDRFRRNGDSLAAAGDGDHLIEAEADPVEDDRHGASPLMPA